MDEDFWCKFAAKTHPEAESSCPHFTIGDTLIILAGVRQFLQWFLVINEKVGLL